VRRLTIALASPLALVAFAAAAVPKHTPTPLPVIYHAHTTALCSALSQHVKPVVGMMIENDRELAKSPPLFKRYNRDLDERDPQDQDAGVADRDLTLYHLEQLVGPTAKNVLAMERELEDPTVFPPNPKTADERLLDQMRDQLLKALAAQAATMDLVNGYVTTQQLAELQHEGTEGANINAINGGDLAPGATMAPTTPNPLIVDQQQVAGLAPNPYTIDPLSIPGIAGSVGNTPVTRLLDAIQYVRQMTQQRENIAAQTIVEAARGCRPPATPAPH
jgi:hypothetical protein